MFTDLLIHRVEVRRRSGNVDRFNQPVDQNPSSGGGTVVGDYPCRIDRGRGGLTMEERSRDVFVTRYLVFTDPDVDVNEDDSVRVYDPNTGDDILALSKITNKMVAHDAFGAHHLELEVIVQRGPS